jgi:hypothetical protein
VSILWPGAWALLPVGPCQGVSGCQRLHPGVSGPGVDAYSSAPPGEIPTLRQVRLPPANCIVKVVAPLRILAELCRRRCSVCVRTAVGRLVEIPDSPIVCVWLQEKCFASRQASLAPGGYLVLELTGINLSLSVGTSCTLKMVHAPCAARV